jgi:hypothetical protein
VPFCNHRSEHKCAAATVRVRPRGRRASATVCSHDSLHCLIPRLHGPGADCAPAAADVIARLEAALGAPLDAPHAYRAMRHVAPDKHHVCVSFTVPAAAAFHGRGAGGAPAEAVATGGVAGSGSAGEQAGTAGAGVGARAEGAAAPRLGGAAAQACAGAASQRCAAGQSHEALVDPHDDNANGAHVRSALQGKGGVMKRELPDDDLASHAQRNKMQVRQ